jgi:hypothetical protein
MQQKYILKKEYYSNYSQQLQNEIQPIDFWQRINIPVEMIIEDINIKYFTIPNGLGISIKFNCKSDFVFDSDAIDHSELYGLISKKVNKPCP